MNDNLVLALVIPCYNEEEILEETVSILSSFLEKSVNENLISNNSYISIVDDGSNDNSWKIINELSLKYKSLKGIRLMYNAGHQNALLCGLVNNEADIYVTLDCDLQDDINIIPEMIKKYKEDKVDIVYAVRSNRDTDSFFKKAFADLFYAILPLLGIKHLSNCADFRLVSSDVVNFLRQIQEHNIYLRGLLQEYNFKYSTINYIRKARIGGKEKYSFFSSLKLALNAILNSSLMPIRLITFLGTAMLIFSLPVKSSVFASTGIILIALGIIGEYLGGIFIETKKRPNYIVKNTLKSSKE